MLENKQPMKQQSKKKLILTIVFSTLILSIGSVLLGSAIWYINVFGVIGFDSILFTLKAGFKSVQSGLIDDYIKVGLLQSLLIAIGIEMIILLVCKLIIKRHIKLFISISSIVLSLAFVVIGALSVNLDDFIINTYSRETIFKDNYVVPSSENIVFPENKRNLIYIYLESMETSYTSKEFGGAKDNDLIPELSKIARDNINFSNNDLIGGANNIAGTNWTAAAMVAQGSGIPLKLPSSVNGSYYGEYDNFLPGVKTINDVLHENGYKQAIVLGSDAEYGGRGKLYIQHGVDEAFDMTTAFRDGIIPNEKYHVWWGMEDTRLFSYAKKVISEYAESGNPFAVTMLTADTHHINGYICEKCKNDYSEQYENVIACSSRQVASFVEWIKKQPFYENTTIIICGDHLTMDNGYAERNFDKNYNRHIYNCIINSAVTPVKEKNREFSSLDMFPTTLAAMGCEIKDNRLGLGVNLFSSEKTMIEKMGLTAFEDELSKYSSYYYNNFY